LAETNLTHGTIAGVTPIYSANLYPSPSDAPEVDMRTFPLSVIEASFKANKAESLSSSPSSINKKSPVFPYPKIIPAAF